MYGRLVSKSVWFRLFIVVLFIVTFVYYTYSVASILHSISTEYDSTLNELSLAREALNDSYVVNYELKEENNGLLQENEDLKEDVLFLTIELGMIKSEYEKYVEKQETSSISRGGFNRDEINLFHKLVESEATGQSFEAKVNVANVVLNRIESKEFPDTIKDVVFQDRQFSVINDGRFYDAVVTNQTVKAVEYAMNNSDTTYGALFFMQESASDSDNVSWFKGKLEFIMVDDSGHSFWR